jgi:aldehyde dehydrogenase (NAD+)
LDEKEKFVDPTVLDFAEDIAAFKKSGAMEGEIFGPVLPLVRFRDIEEVASLVRERTREAQPLAFYVFTSESKRAISERWIQTCASGAVVVNDCGMHIVEEQLPFGGVGNSGLGAYHGKRSFDVFTHYKPVLWKSRWLDIPMRYPPSSGFGRRFVSVLLWLARKRVTPLRVGKVVLLFALIYKIVR